MNSTGLSLSLAQKADEIVDFSVPELMRNIAEEVPDSIALIECRVSGEEGQSITYGELLNRSRHIARWLLSRYQPGDHIAIWSPNNLEWFLLQLGVAAAGMTLVTVNPSFKETEAEYIVKHSRTVAMFALREFRKIPILEIARQISAQDNDLRDCYDLLDVVSTAITEGAQLESSVDLPDVKPDAPCMIQYTSGTTGNPKGVLLNHRAVVNYAKFAEMTLELPKGSKWINFMPMFHTGGCIYKSLGCVWNRGVHLLFDGFDPEFVLKMVEKHQAHFIWSVPTMYFSMLELENFDDYDKSSLIVIAGGATTVPPELVTRLEQKFTGEYVMLFGQTETGVICSTVRGDTVEHKAHSVGRGMPHVDVKIIDPANGELLPFGEVGEICTRSVCVLDEYYDMPEATANAVDAEGWLHTGDLGVMETDEYCRITGRIKDMIIRGGENIFPREVEDTLIEHPEVLEVAVFGVPDERWGEQVAAAIRVAADSTASDEDLMEFLRERIARHKVPRVWQRVNSFPMTASGKIQKFALRDNYIAEQSETV